MIKWRIYYADGSTFDDLDGSPDEAPFFGVLGIACMDGLWLARCRDGLLHYLSKPGMVKCVRMGEAVDNETYSRVLERARADPDLTPDRVIEEGETYYCWMGEK